MRNPTFPWQISARTKETHKDCECSEVQTLVGDGHQALYSLSETRNSNNPFSSLHFSRAVSHDMPSSAAALPSYHGHRKPTSRPNFASRQNSLTSPWHGLNAQHHECPPLPACTADSTKIHPIACKICLEQPRTSQHSTKPFVLQHCTPH